MPGRSLKELEERIAQLTAEVDGLREQLEQTEYSQAVARVGLSYRDLWSNDIMLSRSLADLLGLPPGTRSITRDAFLARVHPEDAARVDQAVREAAARGEAFELEYRIHAGERGWRWFRSNGRVSTNSRGQQRIFSGMADVTERRSLESQLHHAQKMDAIGQLAGGVAHDFNNIMTAIGGYSRLLLESAGETQRADIEEIVKAADRAASLTRQLLAFSSRQVLETALLDVNALVGDMAAMLQRIIGEDVELTTSLAASLPPVRGDRGQLEQVVMNLVVNARDATAGGGAIRIETAPVVISSGHTVDAQPPLKTGNYVALIVSDTGRGMSDEIKRRLFEPFFTTKPRGQGTGLGLATVYGIVAQSGGSIAVTSEPGHGSVFTIYLPRQEHAAPERVVPAVAAGAAGGHETVLLAEDEPAVRTLARRILQRAGYTVVEAANGAEAEARAASMPAIDLLLTDVMMPGGTGPELFRRLVATRPSLRVLFMSGYAEQDLFDRAAIDRSAPFLEKPFTVEALTARVREVLDS
jgi:two-component system, cell cycle sensor histidine kinase and response regulator CckA